MTPFPRPAALAVPLLACAPAIALAGGNVPAHPRLDDTGLTRCTLDAMHWETACAGSGQDAAFGRDAAFPGNVDGHAGFAFRKVCNSGEFAGTGTCTKDAALGTGLDDWGCTYDKVTGLLWEDKQADGGLHDVGGRYTNLGDHGDGDASSFIDAVNAQGLCGASDWRLPDTHELQSIVDFNRASPQPSIDQRYFPNSLADHYWTSEAFVTQESVTAWIVSFVMDPRNVNVTGWGRAQPYPVRLVRPAKAPAAETRRFEAALAPDEVADTHAHLVWKRCVEGAHWNGATCAGTPSTFDFRGAFAHANAVAAETGLPWRVPNAKELHSLVDHSKQSPAIDTTVFPRTPSELFWTATAYAWTPTGGWAVDFNAGHVLAYYNAYDFPVRLVRDAD
jgi:hypothetical protein